MNIARVEKTWKHMKDNPKGQKWQSINKFLSLAHCEVLARSTELSGLAHGIWIYNNFRERLAHHANKMLKIG